MKPGDPRMPEDELIDAIASFRHDFLGFVQFAFPWGEPDTVLYNQLGPQVWQAEDLIETSVGIGRDDQKIQQATSSGKGIGKSALVSWKTLCGISTFPETRGVVTAGTETQLRTKTWPELSKWYQLCICRHWFRFNATSLVSADANLEKTWRVDAIPWSEKNKEAFAGLHNLGKRQFMIFDEASQIADTIFETSDGIMTDAGTEVFWSLYGNPTRNEGRFRDCFGKYKHRWKTRQIDSRTVAISDKAQIAEWVEDWGEDSDYVRVNVRGLFPRVASTQFISTEAVAAARKRDVPPVHLDEALILGVDIARQGDDETVLAPRKGRDARTIPWVRLRTDDLMVVAAKIADMHQQYRFDAIHVDGTGVGGGVVDRLRQLSVPNVREIQFGGKADRSSFDTNQSRYANKRAEMWGYMRDGLNVIAIPDEQDLEDQLIGTQFSHNGRDEILLEKKESVKKRGPSPDRADALALTYAYPVFKHKGAGGPHHQGGHNPYQAKIEYDTFSEGVA